MLQNWLHLFVHHEKKSKTVSTESFFPKTNLPRFNWAGNLYKRNFNSIVFWSFWSELEAMALPPAPSVSFPSWFMIYFSLCFSLVCLLKALSSELVMNIWGWTANSRVGRTHPLALMCLVLLRSEPVPENGLPGCQCNAKLLKYLNIRSLRRLPCNYTCSFHILPQFGRTCACMNMDRFAVCVGVCISNSVLSRTIWMCICCGTCVFPCTTCLCKALCVFVIVSGRLCVCTAAVSWTWSWNTLICSPLPAAQINTHTVKIECIMLSTLLQCQKTVKENNGVADCFTATPVLCCYITSFHRPL